MSTDSFIKNNIYDFWVEIFFMFKWNFFLILKKFHQDIMDFHMQYFIGSKFPWD